MTELDEEYKSLARELISHPDFNKELEADEKIISPSDFGLHNAKLDEDGQLAFFDFEYAGWDDPAKTIADFFAQPRLPCSLLKNLNVYLPLFPKYVSRALWNRLLTRLPLVSRIIRLKWCYILLNDFHPVSSKRRILSGMRPNSVEQTLYAHEWIRKYKTSFNELALSIF